MSAQRLRRRPNIVQMLYKYFVFTGQALCILKVTYQRNPKYCGRNRPKTRHDPR